MRSVIVLILWASLTGLSLLVPAELPAQSPAAATPKVVLQEMLGEARTKIDSWERRATLALSLTVAVGALGILTGALQKSSDPRAKLATAAAGVTISIITLVVNTAIPADHRSLRQAATQAREKLRTATVKVQLLNDEERPENVNALVNDVMETLAQVDQLERQLYVAGVAPARAGVAHAQGPAAPDWVAKPPEDATSLYFVGFGESRALTDAKEASLRQAIDEATEALLRRMGSAGRASAPASVEALREYVRKSSRVADTNLAYDRAAGVYRHHTLLEISRRFAEPNRIRILVPGLR